MTDTGDGGRDSKPENVSLVFGYLKEGESTRFWSAIKSTLEDKELLKAEDLNRYKGENKESLLHAAIKAGNTKIADELIKRGIDLLATDKDGKTPLHYAIEKGDDKLAQQLFKLEPNAAVLKDKDGKTPLHYAAEAGNLTLANALIKGYKAPQGEDQSKALAAFITQPSSRGPSAGESLIKVYAEKTNAQGVSEPDFTAMIKLLEIAPDLAKIESVKQVLAKTVDADGKNILHYLDSASPILTDIVKVAPELATKLDTKSGKSPLHYAAEKGNADLFNKITGAVPKNHVDKAMATKDKDGNTAFHLAAANGHKAMLGGKSEGDIANLSALNNKDQTPRQAAQASGKAEIADLLHAQEHKLAIGAIQKGNKADLESLLKHNKNLLNAKDIDGNTLLHHAAMADKSEIVNSLLDQGADITVINESKKSARAVVGGGNKEATKCAKAIGAKEKEVIFSAVEKGDKDLVNKLLKQNPGLVKETDNKNRTLLHAAIKAGKQDIADKLIDSKIDLYATDKDGKTPLHYAIEKGDDKLAQKLFKSAPNAAEIVDNNNKSPLHYAAEKGNVQLAKAIGEKFPLMIVNRDSNGKNALHYAAENGNNALVQELFEKAPDAAVLKDKDGKTPLHYAAEAGNLTLANALIKGYKAPQGEDQSKALAAFITQPSSRGPSAGEWLINAYAEKTNAQGVSEPNFPEMIKLLEIAPELAKIESVKQVLAKTVDADGKNILHYLDSKSPILTDIVKAAPELATKLDVKNEKSPLHYAAEKGDIKLVGDLANKNYKDAVAHLDTNGNNLLHIAAANGHKEMVEGFIKEADVASLVAVNKDSKTPRQAAQASGKAEIADLLHAQEHKLAIGAIQKGNKADLESLLKHNKNLLNAKDIDGNTLLHHAAMADKSEIVNSLLDQGADITVINESKKSARAVVGGGNKEEATKCANAIGDKEKQAIFSAVEKGDKDLVNKLLKQNPDLVKEKDNENRTLLHIAAEKGHTEIISALVANKDAEVNAKDKEGKTALHYASENLHDDVIGILRGSDGGAGKGIKDKDGKTAEDLYKKADLFRDVKEGKLGKVQDFFLEGDSEKLAEEYRDKDGKSILHIAAELGHRDVALAIIQENPDLAVVQDSKRRTPYHYSAAEGHNDISNALVDTKGTDISNEKVREARKNYEDIKDEDGKTANALFQEFQVIKAVREGKTQELTERLAKEPKLISAKDKDGNNLLHIAIASNQRELMEKLVKDKPKLMEEKNKSGKSPIESALEKSDEHAFNKVMEQVKKEDRKALLEGEKGKNNGLYHKALEQGKLEHAEIMLSSLDNKEDRLAIVAMPNKEGKNLLHLAAEKGNDQVVSNVLDLVKDVTNEQLVALLTAQDKNGDTPLHSAAKAGNREIFEAFAEKVGAANGINLNELEKILEEVEKKKIREIEALAKETAAENAKSASAQNISQQAASSNQSHEQKGAAYSKEDFLKGAIDSVKFTPCTGEEKKFNSNNQRAMSDPAATHLSERRNEDGSFSYKLNIVEPNSPTKLHKIEGQFGELIFNGAGEMIGAEIKDPSKLNLLGKEQRDQALKLHEERAQGMTKASVVENSNDIRHSLSGHGSGAPALPPKPSLRNSIPGRV